MLHLRAHRRRPRRSEQGAILVMAVPGIFLALAAIALSVDLGRQAVEKRKDQSVADAAAQDAARDPANAQSIALAAVGRNGFDAGAAGASVVAERGKVDASRVFTADPTGTAVRVTVISQMSYLFVPMKQTLTARAVAQMGGGKQGAFTIGTSLASIDTSKATLFNGVLGKMIGGNADIVGWQGLVNSHITLETLRQHLELLDAGVQFGTVDQLLTSDITLAKFSQATAAALNDQGDSNASLFAGPAGITSQMTNTSTFRLGDMIKVAQGSDAAALAADMDVFGLLTGSAMLANGTNVVNVPNIGVTIPNVGSTSLSLKVIEVPQTYIGPEGGSVSTGQVQLTLTPVVSAPISVAGLTGATVAGSVPVALTSAGGTGTLTTVTCPNPNGGERVTVDLKPVSSSVSAPLTVTASVLGVAVTYNVTTTGSGSTDAPPQALDFSYPSEFYPTAAPKRVGSAPLGLGTMAGLSSTGSLAGTAAIPPLLAATVNATLATATPLVGPAVTTALKPVLDNLDTLVLKPLLDTLGVSVGAADVTALKANLVASCGQPRHPILVN
ncbi:MAG TPA: pilus assembly protein TadG-related protein [Acidimicrobiales bacterium]|nr:pilus assembly protein TadG-related protein [Acidimicrobiales bacterium]